MKRSVLFIAFVVMSLFNNGFAAEISVKQGAKVAKKKYLPASWAIREFRPESFAGLFF